MRALIVSIALRCRETVFAVTHLPRRSSCAFPLAYGQKCIDSAVKKLPLEFRYSVRLRRLMFLRQNILLFSPLQQYILPSLYMYRISDADFRFDDSALRMPLQKRQNAIGFTLLC